MTSAGRVLLDPRSIPQPTIQVIATTAEGTRAALNAAIPLASGSSARLVLFVPRIVPFPVDLQHPADRVDVFVERYRQLIDRWGATADVRVCVCRRLEELIARVRPDDPVVVGGPAGRWLKSPEERFAKRLARLGRDVIFAASTAEPTRRRQPLDADEWAM